MADFILYVIYTSLYYNTFHRHRLLLLSSVWFREADVMSPWPRNWPGVTWQNKCVLWTADSFFLSKSQRDLHTLHSLTFKGLAVWEMSCTLVHTGCILHTDPCLIFAHTHTSICLSRWHKHTQEACKRRGRTTRLYGSCHTQNLNFQNGLSSSVMMDVASTDSCCPWRLFWHQKKGFCKEVFNSWEDELMRKVFGWKLSNAELTPVY